MTTAITLAACLIVGAEDNSAGWLVRGGAKAMAYAPREGDLVFFDDRHPVWTVLFLWAGTGPPLHMGIVVKQANGSYGVLEAGPDDTVWVTLQDLEARLRQFNARHKDGITIRRCKKQLTREQSLALSHFALRQDGKPYAVLRLLLQGTPLRLRGPIREALLARTYLDRWSWICSELAIASGTAVGLFPDSVKGNASYPRDLVDNKTHDLGRGWHDTATWRPAPPN